jgi:hypothetical protein
MKLESNIDAAERGPLAADLQAEIDVLGIIQPLFYQGRSEL